MTFLPAKVEGGSIDAARADAKHRTLGAITEQGKKAVGA